MIEEFRVEYPSSNPRAFGGHAGTLPARLPASSLLWLNDAARSGKNVPGWMLDIHATTAFARPEGSRSFRFTVGDFGYDEPGAWATSLGGMTTTVGTLAADGRMLSVDLSRLELPDVTMLEAMAARGAELLEHSDA